MVAIQVTIQKDTSIQKYSTILSEANIAEFYVVMSNIKSIK